MIRLSRLCYDKGFRCPGWNGGGPRHASRTRCRAGHIRGYGEAPLWRWRFLRCDMCNVVTWPYVTRYLSLPWWGWEISYRWRYR